MRLRSCFFFILAALPTAAAAERRDALLAGLTGLAASEPEALALACARAGELHHPLMLQPLRALLHHPAPPVRAAAARALGELAVPASSRDLSGLVASLSNAAADPDADVATAGVLALARYPFPEVRLRLTTLLEDPRTPAGTRLAADEALRAPPSAESRERLLAWLELTGREARGERRPGPEERLGVGAEDWLLAAHDLLGPDRALHDAAVRRLAQAPEEVLRHPFLRQALQSPEVQVRRVAVAALAGSGRIEATLALVPAAKDPDPEVRRRALEALCRTPSPELTAPLVEALSRVESVAERKQLGRALSAHGTPELLAALLAHPVAPAAHAQLVELLVPRAEPEVVAPLLAVALTTTEPQLVERALAALSSRPDDPLLDMALSALRGSEPDSTARRRALRLLKDRRSGELRAGLLATVAGGDGDPELLRLLAAQADSRPLVLALYADAREDVVLGALAVSQEWRGADVASALAAGLIRRPAHPRLFAALLAQGRAHALSEWLSLLGATAQAAQHGTLLDALGQLKDDRVAEPVTRAVLHRPELAPRGVALLAQQSEKTAVPALLSLAGARALPEEERARALEAVAAFGSEEVKLAIRPLARDETLEVRMAARNALHRLEPEIYPRWDPFGRTPLIVESAALGAGLMLLADDIADARLSPAFTGAVGLVLGAATPFLLTLNEDVTLGDAGYFGTVSVWGLTGGYALGRAFGLEETGRRWATLGGEILGVSLAALTMKQVEWGLEEVALAQVGSLEAGVVAAALGALLAEQDRSRAATTAGLLGAAFGAAPVALFARRLQVDGQWAMLFAAMGHGAWLGAFAPGLLAEGWSPGRSAIGLLAGQGAGFFAGLALAQFTELDAAQAGYSAFGGLAGAALFGGLGLTFPELRGRTQYALLEAGSLAGALTLGWLAGQLEMHDNDVALVALGAAAGALGGSRLSVRLAEHSFDDPSFPGGVLLGLGTGALGGLFLSQLVDVGDSALVTSLTGTGLLGAAGLGLGYALPGLDVRARSHVTTAGLLLGLGLSAPFAESLRLDGPALAYAGLGGAAGGFFGGFLPLYWNDGAAAPAGQAAGGALFGAGLGTFAAAAAAQALSLGYAEVGLSALGAAAGSAVGGGLGLMIPGADRRLQAGLLQGAGLLGLAGLTLAGGSGEASLSERPVLLHAGAFGLHGALYGALLPAAWREGGARGSETTGGLLFGAGAGTLLGVAAGSLLARPLQPGELAEASLYAGGGLMLGSGLGMFADDRRWVSALGGGLSLATYAGGLWLVPHTTWLRYGEPAWGERVALSALTTAHLGWIGGWLPHTLARDPTREARVGGVMAGMGLGLLLGSAAAELYPPGEAAELLGFGAGGALLGSGLGLVFWPGERPARAAIISAASSLAYAGGLALAPHTRYSSADLGLIGYAAALGAWQGAWIPPLLRDPSGRDRSGGLLLGSGLGLLSGMLAADHVELEPELLAESAWFALLGSATAGGLVAMWPESGREARALALGLGSLGGAAAGLAIGPATEYGWADRTLVGLTAGLGGWHGYHAARLIAGSGAAGRAAGVSFGAGAGALAGSLLGQLELYDFPELLETGAFALAGNSVGVGLAGLLPELSRAGQSGLIDAAGVSSLALGLLLSPWTEYSAADWSLVALFAAVGAFQGGFLPAVFNRGEPSESEASARARSAVAVGAGAGFLGGALLSQLVEVELSTQLEGGLSYALGAMAGAGVGLLSPRLDDQETVLLFEGTGLAGLTLGLALGSELSLSEGDLALVSTFALLGGTWGLSLPALLGHADSTRGEELAGGALLGAAGLGAGGLVLSQLLEPQADEVWELALSAALGNGLGYGLGRVLPGVGQPGRLALMNAGGLALAGAALAYAPHTELGPHDLETIALSAGVGALSGALLPGLWEGEGRLSRVSTRTLGGGLLLGVSAGAAGGFLLSQLTDPSPAELRHASFGAAMGALSGAGVGLLGSEDDRLAISLVQGLSLAGAVGVGLSGADRRYSLGDLAFGSAYVAYLGWHSLGLTLLLDGDDRQAAGAAMATVGLGSLTGMYLAPYVSLTPSKLLMLFAGNVWGTWIGGWGGALLEERTGLDLSGRRQTGLKLLSSVVGSDLGLAATSLVVGGVLDVEPTRFAVINLSGLAGMMLGMLTAGFLQENALREGNVVGSLSGLILGSVVTSFFEWGSGPSWEELLAEGPKVEEVLRPAPASGSLIQVGEWFPSLQAERGPSGEDRYLLSVVGTFH